MRRHHQPNEVSAGGVLARLTPAGWEVCLVRAHQHWGLPKGHVERGESPAQAALREISEECGLPIAELEVVAELSPSEYVYRRAGRLMFKLVHQFLVTTPGTSALEPQTDEIDEAVWLPIDTAPARASFADTRRAVAEGAALLVQRAR